ncbi:hypothetical protein ATCC90586_010335 [Pythium insidiosum]|nr:hypothetical protein ATCC90586_010335 [Pythium insidiosum]
MAPPTSDPLELTATSNPYLDFYNEYCKTSRKDLYAVFDPAISEKKRTKMYKALDVSVAMKYAWAIPDERALRIIKHFGPIVEMGAGTGYWGRLLELRGVDIVCYDLHVADDDEVERSEGGDDDEEEEEHEDDDGDEAEEEEEDAEEEEEENEGESGEEEAEEDEEEVEVEQIYWTTVHKGTPKV